MFRNQYDSDVTVWSPQGRVHQLEYAAEAVKLGSAVVGLKSADLAVLLSLNRAPCELSSPQPKIVKIGENVGIAFSGITADARVIWKMLRTEHITYQYTYGCAYPIKRFVNFLGNKMQVTTQSYDRRPYGVGVLFAGYDDAGPHIYQAMPTANVFNCKAMAIGSRSQSARTYLERNLSSFLGSSKDELICHGISAIQSAIPNETEGDGKQKPPILVISVAIVGKDQRFELLDGEKTAHYVNIVKQRGPTPGAGQSEAEDDAEQQSQSSVEDPEVMPSAE